MSKKINTLFIIFFIIYVYLEMIRYPSNIINSVNNSLLIWINNIFPILFPFFIMSSLLISSGLSNLIAEICKPVMVKLFKIRGEAAVVLILSMISGFPSGTKCTMDLYNQGIINDKEASKLLMFTHYANPLFVIGTIGIAFLNNKTIGILILVAHYLGGLITGILFRNWFKGTIDITKPQIKKAFNNILNSNLNNIGFNIYKAIKGSFDTLFLILGTITIFMIWTDMINNLLNTSVYFKTIVNGLIEMTSGLKLNSLLNLSIKNKVALSTLFISFSGLAVHMQVYSLICETKIKYYPFFVSRIVHSLISCILILIFINYL